MKMEITSEQRLFDIVENLGEILEGDYHIINTSDQYPESEGDQSFRVYHKQGFCFDIKKVFEQHEMFIEQDGFQYYFSSEWDGFNPLNTKKAIELMTWFRVGLPENFQQYDGF